MDIKTSELLKEIGKRMKSGEIKATPCECDDGYVRLYVGKEKSEIVEVWLETGTVYEGGVQKKEKLESSKKLLSREGIDYDYRRSLVSYCSKCKCCLWTVCKGCVNKKCERIQFLKNVETDKDEKFCCDCFDKFKNTKEYLEYEEWKRV